MKLGTFSSLASVGLCLALGACRQGGMVGAAHTTAGAVPAGELSNRSDDHGSAPKSDDPEGLGGSSTMPSIFNQGTGPEDVSVTRGIRAGLLADNALSAEAKNVKVTTGGGVVIVRGPVKSKAEKDEIWSKVLELAANNRVDDQTEVEDR